MNQKNIQRMMGREMKKGAFRKTKKKKFEYANSHNKDQKNLCGLNGPETRGVWTRTMITASDSSQ